MNNEGGPLTEFASYFQENSQRFRMLDPVSQNVVRASHGFASATFTVLLALAAFRFRAFLVYFPPWVPRDLAHAWPWWIAGFGLLVVYGLTRGLIGAHRVVGIRDGAHTAKEFVRLVIGVAVAVWLGRRLYPSPIDTNEWIFLGTIIVSGIAVYNALIGFFALLVLWTPRRTRSAPRPVPNPRGRARDATRREARQAMRGKGGIVSPLDEQEF